MAKPDEEAVSKPHVAKAMKIEGIHTVLSELSDNVLQKSMCGTMGRSTAFGNILM